MVSEKYEKKNGVNKNDDDDDSHFSRRKNSKEYNSIKMEKRKKVQEKTKSIDPVQFIWLYASETDSC